MAILNRSSALFGLSMAITSSAAFGQAVDLNLQTRIETLTPQINPQPTLPETERTVIQHTETHTVRKTVRIPQRELFRQLNEALKQKGESLPATAAGQMQMMRDLGIKTTEVKEVKRRRVVSRVVETTKEPKPTVTVLGTAQQLYDTNAAQTPRAQSDWVSSATGLIVANIPIGANNLVIQSGLSTQRFAKLHAKDVDIAIGSLTYNHLLCRPENLCSAWLEQIRLPSR